MKNALIIYAHKKYEGFAEGRLNRTLVEKARQVLEAEGIEVKTTHIEDGYDIEEEIAKHEWADLVITQTPVNWFNTPWIHKQYIDEVFTTAMSQGRIIKDDGRTRKDPLKQYGTGGLCGGKKYLLSATWNAPEEAFNNGNQCLFEGKSADDALTNLSTNYKYCGYRILTGFHSHDVVKQPQVERDLENYELYLQQIVQND